MGSPRNPFRTYPATRDCPKASCDNANGLTYPATRDLPKASCDNADGCNGALAPFSSVLRCIIAAICFSSTKATAAVIVKVLTPIAPSLDGIAAAMTIATAVPAAAAAAFFRVWLHVLACTGLGLQSSVALLPFDKAVSL